MTTSHPRKGLLMVLSSPSGAGKTTLGKMLLQRETELNLSISVTTRKPRKGEQNELDYRFISQERFEQMRAEDKFLEWAFVHKNYYGTLKADVTDILSRSQDVLFDIDWQGVRQISQQYPNDVVRIFILPPSGTALSQRLASRALDSQKTIQHRLANAIGEMDHYKEYDYVLINHNGKSEQVCDQLQTILAAERMRFTRSVNLEKHVERVKSDLLQ